MGYIPNSYKASKIMRSKDPTTLRIITLWKFKSSKSNKWYIVEVEEFPHHFFGLKFYYKGVAHSKKRYSLLTNDYEPRKIVMSCINIMRYYYEEDQCASFGFVAANDIDCNEYSKCQNKRFRFYRRMMLTMFSPKIFEQYADVRNSVYILANKEMLLSGKLSIPVIEEELSGMYIGEYSLCHD